MVADLSPEDYTRALDVVFPVTPSRSDMIFKLSVRYRPSSGAESQVVLQQGAASTGEIDVARTEGNVRSIINDALEMTSSIDPIGIARKVRVERVSLKVSASRAFAIHAEFLRSWNETMTGLRQSAMREHREGVTTVTLDGEAYEIWYQQGLLRIYGSFSATDADTRTSASAVTIGDWARRFRDEFAGRH